MVPLVGTAPSHRSLDLLRRLVALFDANFIAKQYVRSSGKTELFAIEREARAIIDTPPMGEPPPEYAAPEEWPWCRECHAWHRHVEERRAPRSPA